LKEKESGLAYKNALDLQGVCVRKRSDTRFELRTQSSHRAYLLDVDVQADAGSDQVHCLQAWIQALEQESVVARRASAVILGSAGNGNDSPIKSPAKRRQRIANQSHSPSAKSSESLSSSAHSSPRHSVSQLSFNDDQANHSPEVMLGRCDEALLASPDEREEATVKIAR